MLGAIVGDIVGSRFEFNNHRSKEFKLFDQACSITDDSIMTLAVAQALMETEKSMEPKGHTVLQTTTTVCLVNLQSSVCRK